MPIWIYIAGVLFTFRKYKHTEYIITDKGVYISGGIFAYTCQMKSYMDISSINIHRGVFDQQLKVGDVVFSSVLDETNTQIISNNNPNSAKLSISNISDYQQVFNLVKKLQIDVFSDTMYPNDLRPAENHGYKTKYKGL
ncbi:MAG: PH domain-containing protein [Rickettsiales bacterium]|nr:PH domain-containing protein [Rickettsiales bacterium]